MLWPRKDFMCKALSTVVTGVQRGTVAPDMVFMVESFDVPQLLHQEIRGLLSNWCHKFHNSSILKYSLFSLIILGNKTNQIVVHITGNLIAWT